MVCSTFFHVGSSLELEVSVVVWVPFRQMFWNFSCNWKNCLHAFAFVADLQLVVTNLSKSQGSGLVPLLVVL